MVLGFTTILHARTKFSVMSEPQEIRVGRSNSKSEFEYESESEERKCIGVSFSEFEFESEPGRTSSLRRETMVGGALARASAFRVGLGVSGAVIVSGSCACPSHLWMSRVLTSSSSLGSSSKE